MERKKRKRSEERPIGRLYRVNGLHSSIKRIRIERKETRKKERKKERKNEKRKKRKDWLPGR